MAGPGWLMEGPLDLVIPIIYIMLPKDGLPIRRSYSFAGRLTKCIHAWSSLNIMNCFVTNRFTPANKMFCLGDLFKGNKTILIFLILIFLGGGGDRPHE